jgi:hypothetical protein
VVIIPHGATCWPPTSWSKSPKLSTG